LDARDLAERIAAQAKEMWSHLPENEVDADERMAIRHDAEGNFLLCTADAMYKLVDGSVFRARPLEAGDEVTQWRNRAIVHQALVPAGNPRLN